MWLVPVPSWPMFRVPAVTGTVSPLGSGLVTHESMCFPKGLGEGFRNFGPQSSEPHSGDTGLWISQTWVLRSSFVTLDKSFDYLGFTFLSCKLGTSWWFHYAVVEII